MLTEQMKVGSTYWAICVFFPSMEINGTPAGLF